MSILLQVLKQEKCAVMPFMNAYDRVSDTAVSDDMEIAAAMKNGDVYVSEGGVISCIYAAREHDTEDYFRYGERTCLWRRRQSVSV